MLSRFGVILLITAHPARALSMDRTEIVKVEEPFCKSVRVSPLRDLVFVETRSKLHIFKEENMKVVSCLDLMNEAYEARWFPFQTETEAALAASMNNRPVAMYNGWTGEHICSYVPMNHVEVLDAPVSFDFTVQGQLVCGGFECLRTFDVQRPGRDHDLFKLSPFRRSKDGLKGRVAMVSVRKDMSSLAAISTFAKNTFALVDLRAQEFVFQSQGNVGTVRQAEFSTDGWGMFTYSRHHESIKYWDLRTVSVVKEIPRTSCRTNQKMLFDVFGSWIAFGNCTGHVQIFDYIEDKIVFESKEEQGVANCVSFSSENTLWTSFGDRRHIGHVKKINFKEL